MKKMLGDGDERVALSIYNSHFTTDLLQPASKKFRDFEIASSPNPK